MSCSTTPFPSRGGLKLLVAAFSLTSSARAGCPWESTDCTTAAADCMSVASTEADVRMDTRPFGDFTNSEEKDSDEQVLSLGDLSCIPRINSRDSSSSSFLTPGSSSLSPIPREESLSKWDVLGSREIPKEGFLAPRNRINSITQREVPQNLVRDISLSAIGDLNDLGISACAPSAGLDSTTISETLCKTSRKAPSNDASSLSSIWEACGGDIVLAHGCSEDCQTIVIPVEDMLPRPRQSAAALRDSMWYPEASSFAAGEGSSNLTSPVRPGFFEEQVITRIPEEEDSKNLWSERSERRHRINYNAPLPQLDRGMGVDYLDVEGTKGHYPHRKQLPARQVLEQLDYMERSVMSTPRSPMALKAANLSREGPWL